MALKLSTEQLERLNRALSPLHSEYDPPERALRRPFTSPGYHTTLTGGFVHPTRESIAYAVALLDTGDADLQQRSADILHRILAEQDRDPASKTYGIWSWFLEEPLWKMSPPDWNWADFLGANLLQIARDHREALDPALIEQVDEAIVHACHAIIKRNVGPGYTNIAIMGAYVTLIAGELYHLPEIKSYGLDRLKRFHDYTFANGGFTEFNSPTYTTVAIHELGRLRLHAQDADARQMIESLYHRAWEEVAHHFHPPTRQWAGPHSRAYHTLLSDEHKAMIERSVSISLNWNLKDAMPSTDEHRLPTPCPDGLAPLFLRFDESIERVTQFVAGPPSVVGTTYLTNQFVLGSVNRGDLWNQRRSLSAYWGTVDAPIYCRLRFLHDGYDFAAAQFFSVQRKNCVLAGVNFAIDGGDTHVNLDRLVDGRVRASDLRLRLEFGGAAGRPWPDRSADFASAVHIHSIVGKLRVQFHTLLAKFGDNPVRVVWGHDDDACWIDVILHDGPKREFVLSEIEAFVGMAFAVGLETETAHPIATVANDRLTIAGWGMDLSIPVRSGTVEHLQHAATADKHD